MSITIGIAEDHLLIRQMLVNQLRSNKNIHVLFDVNNGRELFKQLADAQPEIILLDIEMPVLGGKDIMQKLNARYNNIKVIILTVHYEDDYIARYMGLGARAFLSKNVGIDTLSEAIQAVHETGHYYDRHVLKIIKQAEAARAPKPLSEREKDVARLLCKDLSNVEISRLLKVSADTVYFHRKNIEKKTSCKTVIALIRYCMDHDIITL